MLMVLSLPGSRTAFEAERRKGKTAQNLGRLIDEPCDQTATTWAVDYLFRGMEPSGLADIRTGMLRSLINARRLEDCRFDREYLVAVDGTEQHRFKDRDSPHCPECLKQTHSNGTTDYFHSVLEAKLAKHPKQLLDGEDDNEEKSRIRGSTFRRTAVTNWKKPTASEITHSRTTTFLYRSRTACTN
jgi:hypothetical protein